MSSRVTVEVFERLVHASMTPAMRIASEERGLSPGAVEQQLRAAIEHMQLGKIAFAV